MTEDDMALNDGEKILWQDKPNASLLGVWFFTKVVCFVLVVTFLTFWCSGFIGGMWAAATHRKMNNPFMLAAQVLKFTVPFCALAALAYCVSLRQTYHYFVTNQRLVFIGGLLMKKRRSVHYHKVTDLEVSQNFLEQLLGIRSLKIFTAGTSSVGAWGLQRAEITFPGLKEADTAEQLINNVLKSYRATGE